MSITYDYRVNKAGEALGSVVNTASTSASLTTLDTESNYEFSVRQRQLDTGVIYYSPWILSTFQTAAVAQPVVVDLGLIAHSATLNALTAFVAEPPPILVVTYDLLVEQVGTGTSRVTGLTGTTHTLTGLTTSDEYNVSARSVSTLDGIAYYSAWSSPANFTAAGVEPVFVNLGLITHSVTINDVIPFISEPPIASVDTYDLRINHIQGSTSIVQNLAATEYALTGLIQDDNYEISARLRKAVGNVFYYSSWAPAISFTAGGVVIPPVIVNLGLINHSVTLNSINALVTQPTPTTVVTYSLRVEEVGVDTAYIDNIPLTEHSLSGLTLDSAYIVSVRRVKQSGEIIYLSAWSALESFVAESQFKVIVDLGLINHAVTLNSVTPVIDPFELVSFNYENTQGQPFRVLGTTTKPLQSLTVTINGSPMMINYNGNNWDAVVFHGDLMIAQMEELDGPQTLVINNLTLEVA